jgi:hypothetical protein
MMIKRSCSADGLLWPSQALLRFNLFCRLSSVSEPGTSPYLLPSTEAQLVGQAKDRRRFQI